MPPADSYPLPTITWQFNGEDLVEDQRRMTTADHRLVLLLTDSSDQGTYACKANNHGYGSIQTGPGINLTVQGMQPKMSIKHLYGSGDGS